MLENSLRPPDASPTEPFHSSMSVPIPALLQPSILETLRLAQASCEIGDWEKVIGACESAIAQSRQCQQVDQPKTPLPKQMSIQALLQKAEDSKQKGDIPEAVHAYLKALQIAPSTYSIYNRLRYNLMRYDLTEGDPLLQEIVDVCQEICDRLPTLQPAQVTLAYGLTKLGKTQAATACYRRTSDLAMKKRSGYDAVGSDRQSPDFMVIGAEKCGTTSLFQYLYKHPEILSPIEKEIDFFDTEYKQGLDWYLAHFPAVPRQSDASSSHIAAGETSANYLYHNLAPARVFEHFPNIQLIVLLRHPVDRTLSRYNMMVRNGSEKRTLEVAIAQELRQIRHATTPEGIPWTVLNRCRHIGNSLYYYHLQRWLTHFAREQLLVLPSEKLFAQPDQALGEICRTLRIGPPPEQTYKNYNAGDYSAISPALRHQLNTFYQPHIDQLETLLSQSFSWDLS